MSEQHPTTLELARRIADAVTGECGCEFCPRAVSSMDDIPTQAVLRVLRETGSWFCRMGEDANGNTLDTPYEQFDLFTE